MLAMEVMPQELLELNRLLEEAKWPKLTQTTTTGGYGIVLGVTKKEGLTRMSPHNTENELLVREINRVIATTLGKQFRWSTIQLHKNTIQRPQVNHDHLGPTTQIL